MSLVLHDIWQPWRVPLWELSWAAGLIPYSTLQQQLY